MDEKPTVQMDSYPEEEARKGDVGTPSTIPIDDLFHEPEWPSPAQESTPTPFGAPPPMSPEAPQAGPAGETVIMRPEAAAPLLAWLAVAEGPGAPRGQIFALQRETVIGRKAGQILLSGDAFVSGQHAKVRLERSEEDEERLVFVLYDLASANGTFVGDRENYRDNQVYRHELQDGDFLLLGETTLVFKQVGMEDVD
jgi:hypothetical protein